jgi:hypothetical protein
MSDSLMYAALERNTGAVGQASVICDEVAVNAEIEAITQHQDPASENAAAVNKAIVLELAKQLNAIGADPQLALESGTFTPGEVCRMFHSQSCASLIVNRSVTQLELETHAMTTIVSLRITALSKTLQRRKLPLLLQKVVQMQEQELEVQMRPWPHQTLLQLQPQPQPLRPPTPPQLLLALPLQL